jgi:hypothetical protein
MRYYLSTVGGDGRWPTVHLSGDKLGIANLRTGTFKPNPDIKDVNTDDLQRRADMFSRKTGGPAIYLARIGIDGSSGSHLVRHSILELQVTNAALNAIKQRHGYEGFHLTGQSGGASLVGALLGLREDIGCAVPGSGRLAHITKKTRRSVDPAVANFDPSESVALIARSGARILVLTDPRDQKVLLQDQTTFVELLRRGGGQAEQFFVEATDEHHHNTIPYAATAIASCIRGEDTQMVAQKLAEEVRIRVAAANAKSAERITKGAQLHLRSDSQLAMPQMPQRHS